ncbi:unnamed protein product [Rotaria sp. Silwood2]|nr:unnamed protein product [Rotaria sp. Silwood2]
MQPTVSASPYANYTNNYNDRRHQSSTQQNFMSDQERMAKFQQFIRRYKINATFASKLRGLDGYEIVFICDDSSSMNTELSDVSGPYKKAPTRWNELKQTVSIVVDLASTLDPDGLDVYFLNREPMYNVQSSEELTNTIISGPTPIVRVLRQVLKDKRNEIQQRKLLILLATDGVPTDDNDRIPVTIIACTGNYKIVQYNPFNDDECMSYLNNWDKDIPNLDVVDDYRNEKKEILSYQGKSFPFSYGDYVVKILMGGIDPWFDLLDERKISTDEYERSSPRITINNNF